MDLADPNSPVYAKAAAGSDSSAGDGTSAEPPAEPPDVSTGSDASSGDSPYGPYGPSNGSSSTAGLPGGGTGQGPPPKGGSSVNVGAIVGGVIAANGEPSLLHHLLAAASRPRCRGTCWLQCRSLALLPQSSKH